MKRKKDPRDRGIYAHTLATGKVVWYVRCRTNGPRQHFGSFATKSEAKAFYHQIKAEGIRRRNANYLGIGDGLSGAPLITECLAGKINLDPESFRLMRGVYFLLDRYSQRLKIGHSKSSIVHRIRALQSTSPTPLYLLAVAESNDPATLEADLHFELEAFRTKGEWFRFCDESLSVVQRYMNAPAKAAPASLSRDDYRDVMKHAMENVLWL